MTFSFQNTSRGLNASIQLLPVFFFFFFFFLFTQIINSPIVGDKAKGRITNIFYPLIRTCVSGGKNVDFSENLACFIFLKYPFWDQPFCLITDEMKIVFAVIFTKKLNQYQDFSKIKDSPAFPIIGAYFLITASKISANI